eukprot:2911457-Prymnesium_polylepis.2
MMTDVVMPQKRPWSTTPTVFLSSSAACTDGGGRQRRSARTEATELCTRALEGAAAARRAHLGRVLDRLLEEEVDDVVAVVGDRRLVAVNLGAGRRGAEAQLRLAARERRQARDLRCGASAGMRERERERKGRRDVSEPCSAPRDRPFEGVAPATTARGRR